MSLSEAAPNGRLAGLIALRDLLANELDTAEQSRDVAALSRQFTDVLLQIDELEAPTLEKPLTALDELNKRREARAKKAG
ncbi:MAG: hypothetical protein M3536_00375 [Actinomycetota bacterium]|nr:hypothetical protein [Actinomycetota bacterium]